MNRIISCVFVYLLLILSVAALAVPHYTITDLGTYDGVSLNPTCLSNSGIIAGTAGNGRAFIYSPSDGVEFITPPAGYSNIKITRINDTGDVIGCYYKGSYSDYHSFAYSHSIGIVDFTSKLGGVGEACDINNSGTVVGYFIDANQITHLYSTTITGTVTDMGVIDSSAESYNISINNSSQILLSYQRRVRDSYGWESLISEAFIYLNGQVENLHSVDEIVDLAPEMDRRILGAYDLNDLGQIVGVSGGYWTEFGDQGIPLYVIGGDPITYYDNVNAFLYTPGKEPLDLGVLPGFGSYSTAFAVNDLGQVVGRSLFESCPLGDAQTAFLYSDGNMYDLNTLIDGSNQGWMFEDAYQINNKGQILACKSQVIGNEWFLKTFLLTPVPEPSSLAVFLSGFGTAAFVVIRRKC